MPTVSHATAALPSTAIESLERALSAAVTAAAVAQPSDVLQFIGELLCREVEPEELTTEGSPVDLDEATVAWLQMAMGAAVSAAATAAPTQPNVLAFVGKYLLQWPKTVMAMLQHVELLRALGEQELAAAVKTLKVVTYKAGDVIYRQYDDGHVDGRCCYFVVHGECYATHQVHELAVGTRVMHKKHGVGTVVEVSTEPSITKVEFDKGESHRYTPPSLHKLTPVADVPPQIVAGKRYSPDEGSGHVIFFGERALSRSEPRSATVTCARDATLLQLTADTFLELRREHDRKEHLLRGLPLFETFGDDQIAALASLLEKRECASGEQLVVQGEEGEHFYILDSGTCVASVRIGDDVQNVKTYEPGELFGEKALLEATVRAATITAVGEGVQVWMCSRGSFEGKLGSLSQLKAEQYLTDPRAGIAEFYGRGDAHGPAGTLAARGVVGAPPPGVQSAWFAVYRPCSRDSIAKMLGRVGTGKGLNIKGKSAKKNRLSGFVPFCQISQNGDKAALEAAPADARVRIFYKEESACELARKAFESILLELQVEKGKKLPIDVGGQEVRPVTAYAPNAYGLDVPELLLMHVYIHRRDVSPEVGWETGRGSEPAFLDMNRHALRDGSEPPVVLYQFDQSDPLNPLGLLMAYAERTVTPVVSDFDTFLVGSKGVSYEVPPPPEQVDLMKWALGHTRELLHEPNSKGWMARWLNILKEEARNGFHPPLPKYGFGDTKSYGLIGSIVDATSNCGAVRHGAECFNFYFPQELDPDFLIVWDGFGQDPPWRSVSEPELRRFLLERARDGFSFPLNPVWPVRDQGWLEVLEALQQGSGEQMANLRNWFPPESGVLNRIAEMHAEMPDGFKVVNEGDNKDKGKSFVDCDTRDIGHLALLEVFREVKARWRRIRVAVKQALREVGSE